MAQIVYGIRSLLSFPLIYELLQTLVGADRARKRFVKEFVQPFAGARVLDIGCGTGKILEYIPDTIEYIGLDLNPKYIKEAHKKYKNRGQFYCTDVSELSGLISETSHFDIIWAISLLHHLADNEVIKLCEEVYCYLKKGGMFITIDPVLVSKQSFVARYIITRDRGQNVRISEDYIRLAKINFTHIETFILDDMLRIPYNHCILRLIKD